MYEFNDLNPRSKPFGAPVGVEAVTYNGHQLDTEIAGFQTLTVEGREDFSRKINSVDASGDGTMYLSSKLDERELVVNFYFEATSVGDFNSQMQTLTSILREPNKEVSFADDLDHYYVGTPKLEVSAGTLTPTGKITFTLNSPFRYSTQKSISVNSDNITIDDAGSFNTIRIDDAELQYNTLPLRIAVTMSAGVSNFTMTNGDEKFTTATGLSSGDTVTIDFENLTYTVNQKDQTSNVSLQSNFGDFYIKNGDTINVNSASEITVVYRSETL